MLAPTLVEDLEHDVTLDLLGHVQAAGIVLTLLFVERDRVVDDQGHNVVTVLVGVERLVVKTGRVVGLQIHHQRIDVPVLGELRLEPFVDRFTESLFDHLDRGVMNVFAVNDLLAPSVHDLALFVHHFVVLEHVFTYLSVTSFNGVLRALDCLGNHLGLNCLVVGHRAVHDPRHRAGREEAQQVVF